MTLVVKRDSNKERFDERKIKSSIEAAAKEAGLPEARVRLVVQGASKNIIDYVRRERQIRSSTIREILLNKLDTTAPEVSKSWREYDRRTKGLS